MTKITTHSELRVYQLAYEASMQIFHLSRDFPKQETYALTDQIRRSSRSVCANMAEAWRKRRYEGAFINALCIAEAEAAETQVWLSFACDCGYLDESVTSELTTRYDHILGSLVNMIRHPEKWVFPDKPQ